MILDLSGRYTFCASHMLPMHKGKCSNLHGHEYVAEVGIGFSGAIKDDGMIVDFGDIKDIFDKADHALIVNTLTNSITEMKLIELAHECELKTFEMSVTTTAENLAQVFAHRIAKVIEGRYPREDFSVEVKLWETPKYSASFVYCKNGGI